MLWKKRKKQADGQDKPDPFDLEERIKLCEQYTRLWSQFFNFFGDGFTGRKATSDMEAQFFRIVTELARKQFKVSYFLGKDLGGSKHVAEILREAVNVINIVGMSEAQRSRLQHEWHIFFIALNKCQGRLIAQRPPEEETTQKARKRKKKE